jgi:hypothetical protein
MGPLMLALVSPGDLFVTRFALIHAALFVLGTLLSCALIGAAILGPPYLAAANNPLSQAGAHGSPNGEGSRRI